MVLWPHNPEVSVTEHNNIIFLTCTSCSVWVFLHLVTHEQRLTEVPQSGTEDRGTSESFMGLLLPQLSTNKHHLTGKNYRDGPLNILGPGNMGGIFDILGILGK